MTHSPAHGHKRAEVSTQALICLFIQTGKSTEAIPIKVRLPSLKGVWLLFNRFHAKSGNYSVKVAFFSTGPPENYSGNRLKLEPHKVTSGATEQVLILINTKIIAGNGRTTAPPNSERCSSAHLCCRSCRAISFSLLACSHLRRLRSPFASASIFSCSCL